MTCKCSSHLWTDAQETGRQRTVTRFWSPATTTLPAQWLKTYWDAVGANCLLPLDTWANIFYKTKATIIITIVVYWTLKERAVKVGRKMVGKEWNLPKKGRQSSKVPYKCTKRGVKCTRRFRMCFGSGYKIARSPLSVCLSVRQARIMIGLATCWATA